MTVGTGKEKKNHSQQIRLGKEAATFKVRSDQVWLRSRGQEVDGEKRSPSRGVLICIPLASLKCLRLRRHLVFPAGPGKGRIRLSS